MKIEKKVTGQAVSEEFENEHCDTRNLYKSEV